MRRWRPHPSRYILASISEREIFPCGHCYWLLLPVPAAIESRKPQPVGRRVALVIGNAAYKAVDQLVNPRNDAVELGRFFRRVTSSVLAATGNHQEPTVYGSIPDEDFYFKPAR